MGRQVKIVGTEVITTQYLSADGKTYEITVSYDAEANIPEGSELKVEEVSRQAVNEDGEKYSDIAKELLDVDAEKSEAVILFDISIVKNGKKVQPAAPVNVEVKLLNSSIDETAGAVHFGDTKTEVLDTAANDDAVTFETSSFSIYAFKELIDNEDGTYDLMLSVTGSSSSVTTYTDINVIFVLDTSNSMRYRATSKYGSLGTNSTMSRDGSDGNYFQLYKQSGNNYVAITDAEEYTGTVYYYNSSRRRYDPFSGTRVSGTDGTTGNPYNNSGITGSDSRLAQTNIALNTVMTELAKNNTANNSANPDAVEMYLITFNNDAPKTGSSTSWSTSPITAVTSTSSGTNWQAGLTEAISVASAKKTAEESAKGKADDTYVIFLTDGSRQQGDLPTEEASTLNNTYAGLHLIYAYGTDTSGELEGLSNSGYYTAEDTETLVSSLTSILGQINNANAYEEVVYNDGVTSLTTSLVAKDIDNIAFKKYRTVIQVGDKYYYEDTYDSSKTDNEEADAANIATATDAEGNSVKYDKTSGVDYDASYTYVNNSLKWDVSDTRLEKGWLYTSQFTVWPSQEAYDLVADLNNGNIEWSDLTEAEQASIYDASGTGDGPFSLRTNTEGTNITYNEIKSTSGNKLPDKVTATGSGSNISYSYDGHAMTKNADGSWTYVSGTTTYTLTIESSQTGTTYTLTASTPGTKPVTNPDPVPLEDGQMTVKKEWDDSINDRNESNGVIFYLWEDGVKIKTKNGEDNLQLPIGSGSSAVWADTIDVAPGLMTVKNGTIDVKELGHNYTLTEEIPGDIAGDYNDYSYEFSAQTVRPMEVNGELQYLILVQEPYYPAPSGATTYTIPTLTDDKGHKVTGGTYYVATGTEDATLKGENHKTSELDITKEIDATLSDKTKDELDAETFTYTVTLTSPSGSKDNGVKLWIYTPDEGGYALPEYNNETYSGTSTAVTFTDNTATVTVTINRTQIARFSNLPSGTTYTITETQANGKTLAEEGYVISGIGQGTSARPTPASTSSSTCSGTITETNTRYYNNYQNKLTSVDAELKVQKVLSGYEWSAGPESYEFTISAEDGVPMPENTTVTVTSGSTDLTESFGEAKYTEPGTYSYTITENNAGQVVDGIEYGAAATIVVTVERNNDGTLSVTNISQNYVAATDSAPASGKVQITNTWSVTEAYATKVWENADGSDTAPEGATVVFTLYADGAATEYYVELDGTVDATPTGTAAAGYESEAWIAMFVNLPKYDTTTKEEITYTIAETTGYESYEKDPAAAVVSGQSITNKQIKTPIEITKIGDWTIGTTLSGVQFKVYSDAECTEQLTVDSVGNAIGTNGLITTGTDGKASVGTFIQGTYYLQEVKSADGYNKLSDAVTFTINADGTVTYSTGNSNFDKTPGATYVTDDGVGIYISNPSGVELPKTGGHGTLPYTLGGFILMISALMYGFMMRRRERRLM